MVQPAQGVNELIASRPLRPNDHIRVELTTFKRREYLGLRHWFLGSTDTEWRPGKGLSVPVELIPWLRHSLEQAEATALRLGLLDEEAFESAGLPLPAELGG